MEIIHNIERTSTEKCVATIGMFDGVHLGHQALLDELFRKHGVDSTLMATDSDYVKPLINLLARR